MLKQIAIVGIISANAAFADISFVNGNFDGGDLQGWTLEGSGPGSASTVGVPGQTSFDGGRVGTIAVITSPAPDPRTGGAVNQVYGGAHSVKIGDETPWGVGGYQFNQISQSATVTGTDPGNLFFAWSAVQNISGHSTLDTPFFRVHVRNVTQGIDIYDVQHYETDGGFWTDAGTGWNYSTGNNALAPGWQVENLDLAALGVNVGDELLLEAIARDCNPAGHGIYVYLDGFGNVAPPPGPVPDAGSTALLLGLGMLGLGATRLKKS